MLKELKEYIETWNAADNPKPCNEDIFVKEFLEIINNLEDERDISFDGDNAYGGKQITLRLNSFWYHDKDQVAWFEIAYSPDYVKVYTAKHHGFRVPEYLRMDYDHPRFKEVQGALYKLLYKVFGLPHHAYFN